MTVLRNWDKIIKKSRKMIAFSENLCLNFHNAMKRNSNFSRFLQRTMGDERWCDTER